MIVVRPDVAVGYTHVAEKNVPSYGNLRTELGVDFHIQSKAATNQNFFRGVKVQPGILAEFGSTKTVTKGTTPITDDDDGAVETNPWGMPIYESTSGAQTSTNSSDTASCSSPVTTTLSHSAFGGFLRAGPSFGVGPFGFSVGVQGEAAAVSGKYFVDDFAGTHTALGRFTAGPYLEASLDFDPVQFGVRANQLWGMANYNVTGMINSPSEEWTPASTSSVMGFAGLNLSALLARKPEPAPAVESEEVPPPPPVMPVAPPFFTGTFESQAEFPLGYATMTPGLQADLNNKLLTPLGDYLKSPNVLGMLQEGQPIHFEVSAFADRTGFIGATNARSHEKNRVLAEERARIVTGYLNMWGSEFKVDGAPLPSGLVSFTPKTYAVPSGGFPDSVAPQDATWDFYYDGRIWRIERVMS